VELIIPVKAYYQSYIEAIEEYRKHDVSTYAFFDINKYDIFEKYENYRTGNNLPDGYVKSTYLWFVDGDEFIGEVSIRHSLTDSLLRFGGHIGYGIRYSKWNQGIGTIMLAMALKYAKEVLGLQKILITCNDNNYGSARVIEKNGGILQDKIVNNIDGVDRITRRYWIEI
jgi:predicted acetyltransferase